MDLSEILLLAAGFYLFYQGVESGSISLPGPSSSPANPANPAAPSPSPSGRQSPAQILRYANLAGFTGDDLFTAVAVALAESSGYPNAHNTRGEDSYGLWQIFLTVHPEFQGWNLFDPQTNAQAAFQVYRNAGYSFRPWSTFTGGQYLSYLESAQAAVNA